MKQDREADGRTGVGLGRGMNEQAAGNGALAKAPGQESGMSRTGGRSLKSWIPAIMVATAAGGAAALIPSIRAPLTSIISIYAFEMATVFPAVLILMGLMTVYISRQFIMRHLGEDSGMRGMGVAFLLGTLPTGPLYAAFPLAGVLKAKGARTANIVIFLSAWACIKLPQELVELRFLGPRFMAWRLLFTVMLVIGIGLAVEKAEKRVARRNAAQPERQDF